MASKPQLKHVGIYAWDAGRMVEFYQRVFGMVITDTGYAGGMKANLTFMTADPSAHHQLVIADGRPKDAQFSTVNQLSFHVENLDALRAVQTKAQAAGVNGFRPINHGNAWALYFDDPEGNRIEVYLDSPFYVPQPHGRDLDLSLSDEEILADTERACREDPHFKSHEVWEEEVRTRLSATD